MKGQCWRADFYRLLKRPYVFFAVMGIAAIVIIQAVPDRIQSSDVYIAVDTVINNAAHSGWFRGLILIFAALPSACSYCMDTAHNFRDSIICRAGLNAYLWPRVVWNAAVSFFTSFAGFLAAAAVLSIRYDFCYWERFHSYCYLGAYGGLAVEGQPVLFILISITLFSLGAAFWSTAALMVSAFRPDVMFVSVFPFLASYIVEKLQKNAPYWLNIDYCVSGMEVIASGKWAVNLVYSMLYLLLLILIAGNVFVWRVKRSAEHGTI